MFEKRVRLALNYERTVCGAIQKKECRNCDSFMPCFGVPCAAEEYSLTATNPIQEELRLNNGRPLFLCV
jgi:hypothetical protein